MRIGLGLLLERIPKMRLAASIDQSRFTEGAILSSLVPLPVTW